MNGSAVRAGLPALAVLAVLLGLALLVSCGSDSSTEPRVVTTPADSTSRATPDSLLTSWLPRAYTTKDSAMYAAALAKDYQFQFTEKISYAICAENPLLCDFLPPGSSFPWGKTTDLLLSTVPMFRSSNVGEIALTISVASEDDYNGTDCDSCREIQAGVSLEVTTDPRSPDPLVLTVTGPQVFVVKRDPGDATQWVIFRQVDIQPAAARPSGVEVTSWGYIKAFFRGYLGSGNSSERGESRASGPRPGTES